jgi:hypothetical protein
MLCPDGPKACSGLPLARQSPEELAAIISQQWVILATDRQEHRTLAGSTQPFSWAVSSTPVSHSG